MTQKKNKWENKTKINWNWNCLLTWASFHCAVMQQLKCYSKYLYANTKLIKFIPANWVVVVVVALHQNSLNYCFQFLCEFLFSSFGFSCWQITHHFPFRCRFRARQITHTPRWLCQNLRIFPVTNKKGLCWIILIYFYIFNLFLFLCFCVCVWYLLLRL